MTAQLATKSETIDSSLYHQDYYLWLNATTKLLQKGKFEQVDLVNLIEEIQDMGRREKRGIKNNLIVLLMHLVKYKYQPQKRSNSWRHTIRERRRRLRDYFSDSPSLKGYFQDVFAQCYLDACKEAADETGLSINIFPTESPFTPEATLNPDYLPENED